MIAGFEFAAAGRIVFGSGAVNLLGKLLPSSARKALVVTGRDTSRAQNALGGCDIDRAFFAIRDEPDLAMIREGVALARREKCDLVLALGGGSALDSGKAVAAMLANPGDVLDYLEVIGRGQALANPSAPFVAIPTTAGTGSEVTRNAVISSPEHRVKASLRSPGMLPTVAIVDPPLSHSVPPEITASTGLDALTQLIEPYVCTRANPLTDALCIEGLGRAAGSLRRVFENGQDAEGREQMCVASLFGGLALSNAGLGAVHGLAGAIGGMFNAPHGCICAALLPYVMQANVSAMRQRQPSHPALGRYHAIARALTGDGGASSDDGIQWVVKLIKDLHIRPLRDFGVTLSAADEIIAKSLRSSSMKANPTALSREELAGALEQGI